MNAKRSVQLESATADIEAFVGSSGWDRRPTLFALVHASRLAAERSGPPPDRSGPPSDDDALAPVEQEPLPDAPLDEALAQISWPDTVEGCALSQEILVLPPSAEANLPEGTDSLAAVANHPDRREARLVVGVLRDGACAAVLRLRGRDGQPDSELLIGPDLAPNLAEALLATLHD